MNGENDKVSIDWGGMRGATWMGASGIIAMLVNAATQPGGLLSRFGGMPPPGGPGGPVSREVMDLAIENAKLKADMHADALSADQRVVNARQEARLDCQEKQIDMLYSLTKLTIPNGNLTPGVGPVAVVPVPPPTPPTTPDVTTLASAIAAALAANGTSAKPAGQ